MMIVSRYTGIADIAVFTSCRFGDITCSTKDTGDEEYVIVSKQLDVL